MPKKYQNGNQNGNALSVLLDELEEQRDAVIKEVLEHAPRAKSDPQSDDLLEFCLDRVDTLDKRLEKFSALHVVEPDIYDEHGPHSFVRDLASVATYGSEQFAAQERLQRHSQYHTGAGRRQLQLREAEARGVTFSPDFARQVRALSLGSGAGGEFSPPAFLLDQFASVARSASPLLRALPSAPLPGGCQEVYLPRVTSSAGVMTTGPLNEASSQNVVPVDLTEGQWGSTDQIGFEVVQLAGGVILSQQLVDRGPHLDQYLASDFGEAASAAFENQIIQGSGTNGEALGLLSLPTSAVDGVPGASVITYTSSTPTPAALIASIGEAAATVGNTRLRPPSVQIMSPERYFWLSAVADGSGNEPTQRPGTGTVPSNADQGEYGPIAGLPVLCSGEVPQDLGGSANQDAIIVTRTRDFLWMQSDPVFECLAEGEYAQQLAALVRWHCYVIFVSTRYPGGTASVQGTGMARSSLTW